MGSWYRVVKTIKGHHYVYEQQTYREGEHVRTLNRYIGRADRTQGAGSGASLSRPRVAPLFRDAADFRHAAVAQFDAPKWVEDTGRQLFDEILTADPQEPTIYERTVTTTPQSSRQPSTREAPGVETSQADTGSPSHSPRDVQAEITEKIIKAIETGQTNGTFQMPWHAVASVGLPINTVTHNPYHGVNVLLLSYEAMQHDWPNQWASFQQWKERGASVRKGERGTPIVFYSPIQIDEVEEDKDGKKHVF